MKINWDDPQLPEEFRRFQESLGSFLGKSSPGFFPRDVWDRLAADGNWELIARLQYVENKVPGFSTIVVPLEGFSDNDDTHNAVLDWLHQHKVNILNPCLLITRMERAMLKGRPSYEF